MKKRIEELIKNIRFELFTVRASALVNEPSEKDLMKPVYKNGDDKSLSKDLNNPIAKKLADLAIFG